MAWVQAADGSLVNLDHAAIIESGWHELRGCRPAVMATMAPLRKRVVLEYHETDERAKAALDEWLELIHSGALAVDTARPGV